MQGIPRKALSLLIAVVMVFSMIPAAFAEDTAQAGTDRTPSTDYEAGQWIEVETAEELKAAFTNGDGVNAEANAEQVMGVRLTADITVTKALDGDATSGAMLCVGYYGDDGSTTRGHTVVLDLNGHTLTTDGVERSQLFGMYGGSDFTVTNGIIEMGGTYAGYSAAALYQGSSKLTVDGVKWTLTDSTARAAYGGMFHLSESANTLTVINSDITVSGSVYRGGIIHCANGSVALTNSSFTGGQAVGGKIGTTTYQADGGQIWLAANATLTADNCTFNGGKANRNGGLIFKNAGAGKLTFTDCTFSEGAAVYGGGLFLGTTGVVSFDGCTFLDNTATKYGGSVYKDAGTGKLTILDTTFTGGSAVRGGHIYTTGTNTANQISDCSFTGGDATELGGALYISGKMTVEGCAVTANHANTAGGGAYVTGNTTAVTFTDCIMDNTCDTSGGSLAKYGKGTLTLNAVDITGTAGDGGAVMLANGTLVLNSGSIHHGTATNGGNILIDRDGEVESQNLSYGVFIMNGGSVTGGEAKYGGNIRIYNGRAVINDGEISGGTATGTGPDIQIYSKAAAETVSYVGTATVDMYDCLYIFGGKIGGLIANSTMVSFVSGHAAAAGGFSDLEAFLGAHSEASAEADAEDYLAVTHKNTDEGNDTLPTCTQEGVTNVVCADCIFQNQYDGSTFGGEFSYVQAKRHDIVALEAVAAGCETTGLTAGQYCKYCDTQTVAQEEIAATGHAWDEGVVTTVPTCNGEGVKTYTCGTCGATKTEAVSATGHTAVVDAAVAPTCTETGLTEGSHCSVCGETIVAQEEIVAPGHAWNEGVYTEPTFEADGYTTYTCTTCGETKVEINEGSMLVKVLPQAEVTEMGKLTLEEDEYCVWNGIVSDKESEALVSGEGALPLEVVVNFKAVDTLEECLAGGYAQWLVDFNITIDGLEDGTFVADNCYLAGNYGSYGWIKIPLDGQTIEEGIAYPVVALYDPTLNYKDICKSVKDFTAAIHIDQAILDANPNLTVKLELVMTNPDDATDTMQIGEDLIYGYDLLKSGVVAQIRETGVTYATITAALAGAEAGQTIVLLADHSEEIVSLRDEKKLDLNGYILTTELMNAPYVNTHIIDSTEGDGMIVVGQKNITVWESNPYLPVWVENGYRFVPVALNQKLTVDREQNEAFFRFYIAGDDPTCALQQAWTDGGEDNGVYVQVVLNWKDTNGNDGGRTYTYSDELLKTYASGWLSKEFQLKITGLENVSELEVTAQVVYKGSATVTISGTTQKYPA